MVEAGQPRVGARVTFRELFDRHPIVEIPIIQRDYVQGRTSERIIRAEFLNALHNALSKPIGDATLPLDLDFIYGSVENSDHPAFLPLDGQQRLTTLFLLHWYLAWNDKRSGDFASFIKRGHGSRFSYAVRPSSHEFLDALVCWAPGDSLEEIAQVSDVVADQPWFYRSWTLDPTIQSALTMLDDIHATFFRSEGFYAKLTQLEHPYVTFQLLDLRSFGLSDDLYIKMNARGKPLTTFEAFKARLEAHLDNLFHGNDRVLHGRPCTTKYYFSYQIDTAWTDLFWHYRDQRTNLFDDSFMRLIQVLAIVTRDPRANGVEVVLQALRTNDLFSFAQLQEYGCLDRGLLEILILVLDRWSGGAHGIRTYLSDASQFDEQHAFKRIMSRSTDFTYQELVQFWAYCSYLAKNVGELDTSVFDEWMRVVRNLTANTTYDRLEEFTRSIQSINDLMSVSTRILDHLSLPNTEIAGFYQQQVREEKLKAQLISRNDEWQSLILEAERHDYFAGQIEFILKFSGVLDRWLPTYAMDWSGGEDATYRLAFAENYSKASAIFSSRGLMELGSHRFERALLSMGDYLLPKASNHSFLNDTDRDASWKRLLRGGMRSDDYVERRRQFVNAVFDRIDLNIGLEESLDAVIAGATADEAWRRVMIKNPEIIQYCTNRMVRRQWSNIYLLRKIRMSGEHAELFTYDLYSGPLAEQARDGELAPFGGPYYRSMNTDFEEPYTYLQYRIDKGVIEISVNHEHRGYNLRLTQVGYAAVLWAQLLEKAGLTAEQDGSVHRSVEVNVIVDAIKKVVCGIREVLPLAQ